jgi:hypothetical protein
VIIYLLRDTDPLGGFFCAQQIKPDILAERETVVECRAVTNFPEDVWQFVLSGALPVDVDGSNDSTWLPWWSESEPVWERTE